MLKFMSIESMISSNHLILCCPLLFLPSIFPSIWVFSISLGSPLSHTYPGSCSNSILLGMTSIYPFISLALNSQVNRTGLLASLGPAFLSSQSLSATMIHPAPRPRPFSAKCNQPSSPGPARLRSLQNCCPASIPTAISRPVVLSGEHRIRTVCRHVRLSHFKRGALVPNGWRGQGRC